MSSASSSSSISSHSRLSPSLASKHRNASSPVEVLKRPAAARKKALEDDPWTANVSTLSVNCLGCGNLVKLSAKSLYDNHHWDMHKRRCRKIKAANAVKATSDIVPSPPHPAAQTKSKAKAKVHRKVKRAPSTASSVSSLTPISTPPLTSDEDDDVEISSVDECEPPPRPIPINASGKRDLLTEQYFARAHGIRIRLPPALPNNTDAHIDWKTWNWSELRMPEFITPPTPSTDCGSEDRVDSDVGSLNKIMAEAGGSSILRSESTRAQFRVGEDPMPSAASHHA